MSSRAMRKLHGDRSLSEMQAQSSSSEEEEEDENVEPEQGGGGANKSKKHPRVSVPVNPFDLLQDAKADGEDVASDNDETRATSSQCGNRDNQGSLKEMPAQETASGARRKKKKKKKRKQMDATGPDAEKEEDEIDASVRQVNEILGSLPNGHTEQLSLGTSVAIKSLLAVEHKNLNADNEMRRIFGSNVIRQNDQRRRGRNRKLQRSTWLVTPKAEWPHIGKTGLSMRKLETRKGYHYFTLEHSKDYQQVQFKFFDAVESLNHQNLTALLQLHPYHIDTLLQLSEVCKMSEDRQMATDFIERALYCIECSLHTLFSLTQGICRLDYRRVENRTFFLALFRQAVFVGQRGANRTALEICKLLLSLDPESDPVGVLLMIDHYALRSKEYQFLIRMCNEWEAHRNLSQLPNFAFSLSLAHFHLNQEAKASSYLQEALLMFPSTLMSLLDKCSIQPDPSVQKHPFFSMANYSNQPGALTQLIALYVGRNYSMWKVPEVMRWLEVTVTEVLRRVDNGDPLVSRNVEKRQTRYQGTPRNIHRHIILAEIPDALVSLPPHLANTPVMSYDPLPPKDSIVSYQRPPSQRTGRQGASDHGIFSEFFRSMLPSYSPPPPGSTPVDAPVNQPDPQGAAGGYLAPNTDLRQSLGTLMDAMRDLLDNLRPPENRQDVEEEEEVEEFD